MGLSAEYKESVNLATDFVQNLLDYWFSCVF